MSEKAENQGLYDVAASSSDKERITLWVAPKVKEELKRQAREVGVSASAYVSVLVAERGK